MIDRQASTEGELETGLLTEALAALGPGPWSVLDMGRAQPTTLGFFRHYRCRVGVADALEELAELGRSGTTDPTLLWYELRDLIPVDSERPWDLVLLWDVLDYLPGPLLEAVTLHLQPGLSAGARLHGFVATSATPVPALPPAYEVLTRERLRRRIVDDGQEGVPPQRHTPWHLQRYMPGVALERSRQRRDGRQEHLMRYA